ncbi:leucine-rich repeat domain-containing protein [Treponema sp. R80B11-R83G3]
MFLEKNKNYIRIVLMVCFVAIAAAPVASQTQSWTGNGGKGIRLTVLEPVGRGLSENEAWMLSLVQGSMTSDFNRYSAMTIIDRQNLEKIIAEQNQSRSGNYSEADYVKIGHLTNASLILTGSITKTTNAFMLEFAVTDVESGERRASYSPKSVTPASLENLSAVKEATADLLAQLGVTLTDRGLTELKKPLAVQQVQAETALAQGVVAQRQGTELEALSFFIQAASSNPNLAEAASRLNTLTTSIASGNIGVNVRSDIQLRNLWIERLEETETFYANSLKERPYFLVYSTNISPLEYSGKNVSLSLESIAVYPDLSWTSSADQVVQTVRKGLQATERATAWGLANWPVQSVTSPSPFATSFPGFWIEVEVLNSKGSSIDAKESVWLPAGMEVTLQQNGTTTAKPIGGIRGVVFPTVDSNAVTEHLGIRINSIDGVPADTVMRQGRIRIMNNTEFSRSPYASMVRGLRPGTATEEWIYFSWQSLTGASSWRAGNHHIAVINRGVTNIDNAAYQGQGISHVIIPNTVTSIGDRAFQNNRLTSLILPNSVKTIGNSAFSNNQLTSVIIPNSVTSIRDYAFSNNQLINLTIPNGVTFIGDYAFSNNRITSVIIPNSVTTLNVYINYNNYCTQFNDNPLESVTIGPNVDVYNGDGRSNGRWLDFRNRYKSNNRMAGTYTLEGNTWAYKP